MTKKRRKLGNIKYNNKYNYLLGILLIIICYFRLFFIGEILDKVVEYLIGNRVLLYLFSSIFLLHKFTNSKYITNLELLGMMLLYLSLNLLINEGFIFKNIVNIFNVIISEKITTIILYIVFLVSIILLLSRYKNIIRKEFDIGISKTNKKLNNYKNKSILSKENEFNNFEELENFNYISNYINQIPTTSNSFINVLEVQSFSDYSLEINEYTNNIINTLLQIFTNNRINSKIIQTIVDIDHITVRMISFNCSISISRKIAKIITQRIINSNVSYKNQIWTIQVEYKSNKLVNIKDLCSLYLEEKKLVLGITKFGNIFQSLDKSNIFINYENIETLISFLENYYIIKTANDEKFIHIDFKQEILLEISNNDNYEYDIIYSDRLLNIFLNKLNQIIIEREEYASDLGYNSFKQYTLSTSKEVEQLNIIFHEISSIPLVSESKIYEKLIKIVENSHIHGFNFIFTNSEAEKSILETRLYKICQEKLFFETYSNTFSKMLINTKHLSEINGEKVFYFYNGANLKKVYLPNDKTHLDIYMSIIPKNKDKKSLKDEEKENNLLFNEIYEKIKNNEIITATFIMSKYNISIEEAQKIIEKVEEVI